MLSPKVVIGKHIYEKLQKHVCAIDFQYETGGVLLGYKFLRMFYVTACTFPRYDGKVQATKMSFILDGEEHAQEMERIRKKHILAPKLIGIWHSHTMGDEAFSLQDKESNGLLVKQIGEMISVIAIQQNSDSIRLVPYYVSKDNKELFCRAWHGA